jgi:hypothetical protein
MISAYGRHRLKSPGVLVGGVWGDKVRFGFAAGRRPRLVYLRFDGGISLGRGAHTSIITCRCKCKQWLHCICLDLGVQERRGVEASRGSLCPVLDGRCLSFTPDSDRACLQPCRPRSPRSWDEEPCGPPPLRNEYYPSGIKIIIILNMNTHTKKCLIRSHISNRIHTKYLNSL